LIEARIAAGRDAFMGDRAIQDAVLWRRQTLAEATGRLSQPLKERHPELRWRAIYGSRNVAAHAYIDLNIDVVWEILMVHLSALKRVVAVEQEH
jgi:uncharacterized protein with HEPN domain